MTELDLLTLARSATQNEVANFGQVIAINFAMVVAIFYFLHQARLLMKLFAFVAYSTGMALYLGQTLIEANLRGAAFDSLRALPPASLSHASAVYLGVSNAWLGDVTSFVFNFAYWILWIGIFVLLFFWKREPSAGP